MQKFFLLSTCLLAGLMSPHAGAADVTVHLQLTAANALDVSYHVPKTCTTLTFLNHETLPQFGKEIRAAWQALDDCASVNGETITKTNQTCSNLRFRVPASKKVFDRVSPGSFPVGEGLFVNTTNYAVGDQCGKVAYHFSAAGSIAFKGQLFQKEATYQEPDAQYMPLLLLQKQIAIKNGAISYFDPALAEENRLLLQNSAEQAIDFYRRALPDLHFRTPILAATAVNDGGYFSYWGDAGDVMRLALYNWPSPATPEADARLRKFVWHEFAHRFQPSSTIVKLGRDPFIVEGGADYLRWVGGIKNKQLGVKEAEQEINTALSNCISKTGDSSWKSLPETLTHRGSFPYECGLALHVMGLAARQNNSDALQQMNDYYLALDKGESIEFAQAIECGKDKDCTPSWLPKLLGDQPLKATWSAFFVETQLAKVSGPNREQIADLQRQAFASLMQTDCMGNISFRRNPHDFSIEAIPACKVLREGMQINEIENLPLFTDILVVDEMNRACETRGKVSLGLVNGEKIFVACKTPFALPTYYAVDMPRLLRKHNL